MSRVARLDAAINSIRKSGRDIEFLTIVVLDLRYSTNQVSPLSRVVSPPAFSTATPRQRKDVGFGHGRYTLYNDKR